MPSAKPTPGATNVPASGAAKSANAAAANAAPPTVEAKLVKQSSADKDCDLAATDPLQQIHILIDKRIRNLEKRKSRLETLQEEKKAGKTLIEDQVAALRKYDGVIEMLDFFKEFRKQLEAIYELHNKALKKAQKKEETERLAREKEHIRSLLIYQDILTRVGSETFKEDHLNGSNDAVKLDLKQYESLLELSNGTNISKIPRSTYDDKVNKSVDRLMFLIEGKPKEVKKNLATYKDIKDTLDKIHKSGYLNRTLSAAAPAPASTTKNDSKAIDLSKKEPTDPQANVPPQEFVPSVAVSSAPAPGNYPQYASREAAEDPAVLAIAPTVSIPSQIYEPSTHYAPGVTTATGSLPVSIIPNQPMGGFTQIGHFQQPGEQPPASQDDKTFETNESAPPREKRTGYRGNNYRGRGGSGGQRRDERRGGDNRSNGYGGRDRNSQRNDRYDNKGGNIGHFNGTERPERPERRAGDHYRSRENNRSGQKNNYNPGSQNPRNSNPIPNAAPRQQQ